MKTVAEAHCTHIHTGLVNRKQGSTPEESYNTPAKQIQLARDAGAQRTRIQRPEGYSNVLKQI